MGSPEALKHSPDVEIRLGKVVQVCGSVQRAAPEFSGSVTRAAVVTSYSITRMHDRIM